MSDQALPNQTAAGAPPPPAALAAGLAGGSAGGSAGGGSAPAAPGSGSGQPALGGWRGSLPEALRALPILEGDSPEAAAQALATKAQQFAHAQKLLGERFENMKPEVADQVFKALGRPDKPDGYTIETSRLPADIVDADFTKSYQEVAHKAGLTPAQHKAMTQWYQEKVLAALQSQQAAEIQAVQKTEADLLNSWGNAFDQQLAAANTAFRALSKDLGMPEAEFLDELKRARLIGPQGEFRSPLMAKILARVGAMLSGPSPLGGLPANPGGAMTPASAKAEIATLKRDRDFQTALMTDNHPGHKAAVDRMAELYRHAHAGE